MRRRRLRIVTSSDFDGGFLMNDFIADLMEVSGCDYDAAERAYTKAFDADPFTQDYADNYWSLRA